MSGSLADRVAAMDWYHQIDLPGGITTPGVASSKAQLPSIGLPDRLDGTTVLDVGAWDGFYSFECARRGAARVLATDSYAWEVGRPYWGKEPFKLARTALGLEGAVEDLTIDVDQLSPETVGTFDLVLFLGVLYHLKDPISALERVASVCDDHLIVETETALNWLPGPAAAVHPTDELAGDETNWFSMNARAVVGLLRAVGFERVEVRTRTTWPRRVVGASRARLVDGRPWRKALRSQRLVVHAFKR